MLAVEDAPGPGHGGGVVEAVGRMVRHDGRRRGVA